MTLTLQMNIKPSHILNLGLALLRRLTRTGSELGSDAKRLQIAANSLVYTTFEYCAPVWCRSVHTRPIEKGSYRRNAHCHWMSASDTNKLFVNPNQPSELCR